MRYNNLIIDASNLFWRATHKTIEAKKNKLIDSIYNNVIKNAFDRLRDLEKDYLFNGGKVFLLFDNPDSAFEFRKIISCGTYKHDRESKSVPPALYKTLDLFEVIATFYDDNYYIVKSTKLEADDLTIVLKRELPKDDKNLYISADMDWARNMNDNSDWFNWATVYDIAKFKEVNGFSPEGTKITLYKAIHGDTSDCINNAVPYLPKNILRDIVVKCDTVKDFSIYIRENTSLSAKWKADLLRGEDEVKMNFQLVDFVDIGLHYDDIVTKGACNLIKLRNWFNHFNIPLESRMHDKTKDSWFGVKRAKRFVETEGDV